MLRLFFLISISLIARITSGQSLKELTGKSFVTKSLQYLALLNDTTLSSSINEYNDTATFFEKNHTLYIKQQYGITDKGKTKWVEKLYDYTIVTFTEDSLTLVTNYSYDRKSNTSRDTIVFVNIEKLKESVIDFKFLKLDCSNSWHGKRHITIDSIGEVTFDDNPILYSINNPSADKNAKPQNISGRLTPKEFLYFKDKLAKSFPSKLPRKRSCGMDGTSSDFEIVIGTKRIVSRGCNLSWTHTFLLNYLYDINKNKGFVKLKK